MKLIDRLLADGTARGITGCGCTGTHSFKMKAPAAVVVGDAIKPLAHTYTYGPLRCPVNGMWVELDGVLPDMPTCGAEVTEEPADPEWWPGLDVSGLYEIRVQPFFGSKRTRPLASAYFQEILVNAQGEMQTVALRSAWNCVREFSDDEYESLGWLETARHLVSSSKPFEGGGLLLQAYATGIMTHLVAHVLGFMNVKNVHLDAHEPPPRLSRAHQRRTGGPPLVKWTTIRLPGQSSRPGPGHGPDKGQVPLHLVRGHFKTYTPDHPLFGQRVGTYWWPAALRGDPDKGERLHEYKLSAK